MKSPGPMHLNLGDFMAGPSPTEQSGVTLIKDFLRPAEMVGRSEWSRCSMGGAQTVEQREQPSTRPLMQKLVGMIRSGVTILSSHQNSTKISSSRDNCRLLVGYNCSFVKVKDMRERGSSTVHLKPRKLLAKLVTEQLLN